MISLVTWTEMKKKQEIFGGDFGVIFMSIIYKMQIIILKSYAEGLILGTNTEKLYSIF